MQIKRRAEDGNTKDEDYFLFTVGAVSGFMTVNANDAADNDPDANTSGTLFGPMETGPMAEKMVGQIATDADSGPGSHFQFTVPVQNGRVYVVKVDFPDGWILHLGVCILTGDTRTHGLDGPVSQRPRRPHRSHRQLF